jgi:hypothetical protein
MCKLQRCETLTTRQRNPTSCLLDPYFRINYDGKQLRGPNTKDTRRKMERGGGKKEEETALMLLR